MTAKDYLQQVKDFDADINNMLADKAQLTEMMYCIGSPSVEGDRVQTSVNGEARFETLLSKIDEKEREITRKIYELIDFKLKVSEQISGLKDSRFRLILHKRYLQFMSWEKIAVEMNYNRQYVIELHGYALQAFEKKYHHVLNKT